MRQKETPHHRYGQGGAGVTLGVHAAWGSAQENYDLGQQQNRDRVDKLPRQGTLRSSELDGLLVEPNHHLGAAQRWLPVYPGR